MCPAWSILIKIILSHREDKSKCHVNYKIFSATIPKGCRFANTIFVHCNLPYLLPSFCFEGHFTLPYEQNTQQSPELGLSTSPQFVHL